MKQALFEERLGRTELQMGDFPVGWREAQNEYWQRVWENDAQAERLRFELLGRICLFIPGAPIHNGEVHDGEGQDVGEPTVSAPWPPSKRSLATRVTATIT